jgi:hypothetical protein
LVSRPKIQFQRIEEFISGFIDSLWLADHEYFVNCKSNESLSLIKDMIRSIFKVGTTNCGLLVDHWKQFINWIFHASVKTTTIGGPPEIPVQGNFFRKLTKIKNIADLLTLNVNLSELDLVRLGHLCSSRQMPFMGRDTQIKSEIAFEKVVTSTDLADRGYVEKLRLVGERLGRICRNLNRKRPITDSTAHLSVNSSGERLHPISRGGKAAAVKDAMIRILTRIPEEDRTENTPFGPAEHHKGIPLWKTLYRTQDQIDTVARFDFLSPRNLLKGKKDLFWGLDSAAGKQILYCAWKDMSSLPELRAEFVPEMGNKARIVTVSDYWLNCLQEPLAHLLIEALRFHPSVFSSFVRQDQAWAACEMISKSGYKPGIHSVLSSDLKDATNAQQFEVTKSLIRGFLTGYGEVVNWEYVEVVLGLIGPRLIWLPIQEKSLLTTKGIMMGEAIAKPSLTLLNLAMEELSFLEFTKTLDKLFTTDPSPYRDWRCCHIGGDDHLAVGPIGYLQGITRNHVAAGSMISPGKHGYGRIAVRYTEKILDLRRIRDRNPESIIVDSVKVRLLERGQSTQLLKDNKNVAIGKSEQLARTLQWLPDRIYPAGKVQSIRNLFIKRMGELLPREHSNPRAFALVHLPTILGGYGLGGRSIKKYLMDSPLPHRYLISKMILGIDVTQELKILKKLNRNITVRGAKHILDFETDYTIQINGLAKRYGAINWEEFRSKFPSDNNRVSIALGFRAGWMSVTDFVKQITRGQLFSSLLANPRSGKEFNTQPLVKTYHGLWDQLMELVEPYGEPDWAKYSDAQLYRLVESCNKMWFIDSNRMNTFDLGVEESLEPETYDFVTAPWLDGARRGAADLSVGKHFVGWKGEPRLRFTDHFDEDEDSEYEFDADASVLRQLMLEDQDLGLNYPEFQGIPED